MSSSISNQQAYRSVHMQRLLLASLPHSRFLSLSLSFWFWFLVHMQQQIDLIGLCANACKETLGTRVLYPRKEKETTLSFTPLTLALSSRSVHVYDRGLRARDRQECVCSSSSGSRRARRINLNNVDGCWKVRILRKRANSSFVFNFVALNNRRTLLTWSLSCNFNISSRSLLRIA